jgi:hypothetical protein
MYQQFQVNFAAKFTWQDYEGKSCTEPDNFPFKTHAVTFDTGTPSESTHGTDAHYTHHAPKATFMSVRDITLPPLCISDLRSFGTLSSVD